MSITPETKDWTWVLRRRCPECGYDAVATTFDALATIVRTNAGRWPAVLARPDVAVRPRPDRWSALEYACHVRDVFGLGGFRLGLMLDEDDPLLPAWDQDAAAVEQRYDLADPATVATEVVEAAGEFADALTALDPKDLPRTGRRSDGAAFTIETFARYLVHEPIHHLTDVEPGDVG